MCGQPHAPTAPRRAKKTPVPNVCRTGWVPKQVWTFWRRENSLVLFANRTLNRSVRRLFTVLAQDLVQQRWSGTKYKIEKTKHNWKVASFRDDYWTKEKAKLYVMNSESLPQKFYACRWNTIGRVVATRRPSWKQKLTSKQWNHGSMLRSNSHHASRHKKMCRLWSYLGKQIRYLCEHIQQFICFIGSV